MLKCSICLEANEAFGVLRCGTYKSHRLYVCYASLTTLLLSPGHVFGVDCITQHFNYRSDCPKCRAPASHSQLIRMYLDDASAAPQAQSSSAATNGLQQMLSHLPTLHGIVQRAEGLTVESSDEELRGFVQSGEMVAVQFDEVHSQVSVSA